MSTFVVALENKNNNCNKSAFAKCVIKIGYSMGKIDYFLDVVYRVSQEEWTKLRESVPYVKIYRYNPKYLCPKLNGYGDKGQRKVWSFCGSTYCTWFM